METINICLKILTENKKAVKESFQLKQIPKFASAVELKNYIVSEKVKAANVESLEIGYYGPPRGTRFAIIDETTLAEAYSTEKQEWIVIWVWTPPDRVANKRQSQSSTRQWPAAKLKDCAYQVGVKNLFSFKLCLHC